ncbi:MAG: hypothetical protein J7647_03745 [Cyanobacteria bacterium SBLK]|nr:hypothetical protein [Cyanobacteria bacterium SBLK]
MEKLKQQAIAGLCLRCYISHSIAQACAQLVQQFGATYGFSPRDILPIVLTDTGTDPIVFNNNRRTQAIVNLKDGTLRQNDYSFFAIDLLRQYNPAKQSLHNWTYTLTRQNPELKQVLNVEYKLFLETDWALLNQAKSHILERYPDRDRLVIQAFHRVYRRDRRDRGQRGKCKDPSSKQLQEMLAYLLSQAITFESEQDLFDELKQIAANLRTEKVNPRIVPTAKLELEELGFLEFLHPWVMEALTIAIATAIPQRLERLAQSRHYQTFTNRFLNGLHLIYSEGKSQGEVAGLLGLTNQSQVSRVLKLGDLILHVRDRAVDRLFQVVLEQLNLEREDLATHPDTLNHLMKQIESFIDEAVFNEAAKEFRGKNRQMQSLYAGALRQYLQENASLSYSQKKDNSS